MLIIICRVLKYEGHISADYIQEQHAPTKIEILDKGLHFITISGGFSEIERKEAILNTINKSVLDTNESSKSNNRWSPFFAGLAAFISTTGLIREIVKDKKQDKQEEILKQQMTRQDSLLQNQQTQIDSLWKKTAHSDTASTN